MTNLKYRVHNFFVAAFWVAFWLVVALFFWIWLVVLPGVGLAALFGVMR